MKTTQTKKLMAFYGAIIIIILSLSNCTKPTSPLSAEKNITSFNFRVADNPSLTGDIIGSINSDSVFITLPIGTVVTNLIPSITINGNGISPSNLTAQNFTNPVSYTVTAKNASTKSYTVVVDFSTIDATLFINSSYPGFDNGGNGKIYALDANTGLLKWQYRTTAAAIDASPTFFNGFVYTGIDHNVACIDTTTKNITWNFTTGAFIESTPTIVNGILYINSNDGCLYAIDAVTGMLKWKFLEGPSPAPYAANYSSPTVVDGIVYVGSFDGYVYALEAETGKLKWKTFDTYNLGGYFSSSPSVVNGVLYITDIYYDLIALNANDGSLKWDFKNIVASVSSPTIVGGVVYIGSTNGLYAINANSGEFIWKYATLYAVEASPIVSKGNVFFGITSPNYAGFYAIDALNGTLKWVFSYESDFYSSPIIFNNTVYVGSYACVLAINANSGILKWKYNIDNQLDEVRTSPCIIDKQGHIYYSGISGSQN